MCQYISLTAINKVIGNTGICTLNHSHISLNKYAWYTANICSTALLLYCTVIAHIRVNVTQNITNCNINLPGYFHIYTNNKYTLYATYTN